MLASAHTFTYTQSLDVGLSPAHMFTYAHWRRFTAVYGPDYQKIRNIHLRAPKSLRNVQNAALSLIDSTRGSHSQTYPKVLSKGPVQQPGMTKGMAGSSSHGMQAHPPHGLLTMCSLSSLVAPCTELVRVHPITCLGHKEVLPFIITPRSLGMPETIGSHQLHSLGLPYI